jgi:hypothetical protein
MFSKKFLEDLKLSAEIVWVMFSIIITAVLAMSFFLPEALVNLSPVCISKSSFGFGAECFMCGMTRAFVEIPTGNFHGANILNNLSIYIFALFTLNSMIFIYYLLNKIRIFVLIKKHVPYY